MRRKTIRKLGRGGVAATAIALGVALVPSSAQGSSVRMNVATASVVYEAADDEQNKLVVKANDAAVVVHDDGAIISVLDGGCAPGVNGHEAICPRAVRVSASLGDGDDSASAIVHSTSLRNFAFHGGAGDDTLAGVEEQGLGEYPAIRGQLAGMAGDDVLSGGVGSDLITGGPGADDMSGGEGEDQVDYGLYDFRSGPVAVDLDCAAGQVGCDRDDGQSGEGDIVRADIEDIGGSHFDDVIAGSDADNVIGGLQGNDRVTGGGGQDKLFGGDGGDRLDGGGGADFVFGMVGDDHLVTRDGIAESEIDCGEGLDSILADAADMFVLCEKVRGTGR